MVELTALVVDSHTLQFKAKINYIAIIQIIIAANLLFGDIE